MKKTLFNILLCSLLLLSAASRAQSTVQDGQSTEGKDFWVTFLKADSYDSDDKPIELSLSISAQKACEVTIENSYSKFKETVSLAAGELKEVKLYSGTAQDGAADGDTVKCYSFHSEKVDTTAVHVTSTEVISLFASNWKSKSFDATNVLPTPSLLDEYYIQSYPPSAHGGDTQQGTHFAIVAAEDDVIVDITPTVPTSGGKPAGQTFATEKLKVGQVYYVWTGTGGGDDYDFSGTHVKARDGKKIAVFQGAPHTNIPNKIRDRDHIFSQAMPVKYWGNTFVITSSMTRKRDKVRIMALNNDTEVRINGKLVHTFHFEGEDAQRNDNIPSGAEVVLCVPRDKRTFDFEIGAKGVSCTDKSNNFDLDDPLVEGTSCFIETSCPVAIHLFMVSNRYDDTDDGDPAMIWVNPIEQQINDITFATYKESNTHYYNVVTNVKGVASMKRDGQSIANLFTAVAGSNDEWYYAREKINFGTHHLTNSTGFIAHVYGYGEKESYGYSAGGATKPLTSSITINGEVFSPDTENTLCGEDTIKFACHPDYEYDKIEWYFGDGEKELSNKDSVPHYYAESGSYPAYVLIYRNSTNLCAGQNAVDSIPITVTIGRYEFSIDDIDIPCPEDGKDYIGKVYYSNPGKVNLHGDNVTVEFDEAAKAAGFKDSELEIKDSYFQIKIPTGDDGAKPETVYGIHLVINSDCGGADTTMHFMINFDNNVIEQRYDNVLGLLTKSFEGRSLSDFEWYRITKNDTVKLEGQVSANLNFYDLPYGGNIDDAYFVCFTIGKGTSSEAKTCACPKAFVNNDKKPGFGSDESNLTITATYAAVAGGNVFVNADYEGKENIECYAEWINASGQVYQNLKFDIPDGGCTIPAPAEKGLYLLRVRTGKGSRSFKFIINQ